MSRSRNSIKTVPKRGEEKREKSASFVRYNMENPAGRFMRIVTLSNSKRKVYIVEGKRNVVKVRFFFQFRVVSAARSAPRGHSSRFCGDFSVGNN